MCVVYIYVGPPSEVSNITFNEVCTTSLIVSWNPSISNPVCNPLNYTVSLPFLVNQDPFITSDTNISLTGLVINENNNNLHVTIHSTNMAGNGNNLSSMTTLPNVADAIPGGELLFILYDRGHYKFKMNKW